jgi:iron complex outermembrane recepter protein
MRSSTLAAALLSTTMLSALPVMALAQDVPAGDDQGDVIVTAQKRSEKLQTVPVSIQVLGTKKLDQLNVTDVDDYVALLPSVSFQNNPYQGSSLYFRGVASGGDGNHSGSQPSTGVYLDEQPVTTIGGALDVHIYDVERIESLAGPQGTLYGASSEAGTIRIITNKPTRSGTFGRFDAEANSVAHGGTGGKIEGMFNTPLSSNAALRIVGWAQRNAGFIDNVPGTRAFLPVPGGITVDNDAFVAEDYNDEDIVGGRAALLVDLNDNWTVNASLIAQDSKRNGAGGYDESVGDLEVQAFFPQSGHDRFAQAALTLQGKVGIFDITYAGAHMERKVDTESDYTDYAEAYDQLYAGNGGNAGYFYFYDNNGDTIDPRQWIVAKDKYTKTSHELRVATPGEQRLRFVGGLFFQHQTHDILQDYRVPDLADVMSVNGHPGTLWLTKQERIDRDSAIFGELSFDITPDLTVTAGGRAFTYDNSLIGFFGFGLNPDFVNGAAPNAVYGSSGARRCFTTDTVGAVNPRDPTGTWIPAAVEGSPCTNLGVQNADKSVSPKHAKGDGFSPKLNLTWRATPDVMIYGTYSKGFRPGGINRRGTVAPYEADFLTNYEFGWKTTLLDRKVRFNGAIFTQDWEDFQFSFLGANSFTEVHNGPNARINGIEADLVFTPTDKLTITASGAYTDAKTTEPLCGFQDDADPTCTGVVTTYETRYDTGSPVLTPTDNDNYVAAPKGTRLPITPELKLSAVARYSWEMGKYAPYWQLKVAHQSDATSDIRTQAIEIGSFAFVNPAEKLGKLKGFTTIDFALGASWDSWTAEVYLNNLTDERAQLGRYQQCGSCYERNYVITNTPRTFGVRLGSKF